MNVNRITWAGVKFVFWVADYFALMNLKLGGDIKKIQDCGNYMIEVWKACGMDLTNVEFEGVGWVSDGCRMGVRWVSDGCQMGVRWVSVTARVR